MKRGRKKKPRPDFGGGEEGEKWRAERAASSDDVFFLEWVFDDFPEEPGALSKRLSESLSYRIKAQRAAYFETGNPWFAVTAFTLLYEDDSDIPVWVLGALAPGFKKMLTERDCDPRDVLGLSVESWDKTTSLIRQVPIMMDIYFLVNEFGLSENRAAQACEFKKKAHDYKTYLRWYRNFWRGILRTLAPSYKPMSEFKRTRFIQSFPPQARNLLVKKRRTK